MHNGSSESRPFILVCGDYVRTGGQDVANLGLADYLARDGREVHVVGYRFDPVLENRPSLHIHKIHKLGGSYTMSAPVLTASGLAQYVARIRHRPIVVSNGGNCPSPSLNWVHYVHAAYRPSSKLLRRRAVQAYAYPVSLATERLALRAARVTICNSERTRHDVIERVGVHEDLAKTVYYGMDPARFPARTQESRRSAATELGWSLDRFRAVFIGALGDSRKGLDGLYEAWRQLCQDRGWDGELIVIGIGAELETWRARAAHDGLSEKVLFLGFRPDVPKILAACDVLVAPTRYEAYGLGVHEAICVGLPALVSARAGVAERYPAELRDLLIANPEDAREIADRLKNARERVNDYRSPTRALGDSFRKWTWDDMSRAIQAHADLMA